MQLEAVLKSYARYAPVYNLIFGWLLAPKGRVMAAELANARTGPVLEVGVGTGIGLEHYRPDHQIVGIDISEPMLRKARKRVRERGLAHVISLLEMDATKLEFEDDIFGAVVASYVMSVVPDPVAVLQEIERVTAPGGDVIILNHLRAEGGIRWFVEKRLAPHANHLGWRPDFSLDGILEKTNLTLVRKERIALFDLFTMIHLKKPR